MFDLRQNSKRPTLPTQREYRSSRRGTRLVWFQPGRQVTAQAATSHRRQPNPTAWGAAWPRQLSPGSKPNMCWHYTQVVWRSSTRIGCARVVCSGNHGMFIYLVPALHAITLMCYVLLLIKLV